MFDKSVERFPFKKEQVFLNSCGVSPLATASLKARAEFDLAHATLGNKVFRKFGTARARVHSAIAQMLGVEAKDITFTKNCAEPLNLIANGYPFKPGDEIISYIHEYPSNHFPWKLQERRGAKLVLIPDDRRGGERPGGFTLDALRAAITEKTKIIALSQVQFTSGFAVDVAAVGEICKARGIDLVIDAAQSFGAIPLDPKSCGVAAVVSSGWKWLMGPIGSGFLYTDSQLREKIAITHAGPDMMTQGDDYLDHTFSPTATGERFEYSTISYADALGLEAAITQVFLSSGVEKVLKERERIADLLLEELGEVRGQILEWKGVNRSGIFSIPVTDGPGTIQALEEKGVTVTVRGGYLRLAPQFYLSDDEVKKAASAVREVLTKKR